VQRGLDLAPRAAVSTGSRAVVAVILLVPLGGCAHRQPRSTTLGAPPPPRHAENLSPDHLQRADEALDPLRKRRRERPTEDAGNARRDAESGHPTDADAPASGRSLGTSWSVVVNQPPSPQGDAAVNRLSPSLSET
jgi:hypothetical protein